MIDDIYTILSKHFSGLSNSEEEQLVSDFRKSDPLEYEILHKLWQREGSIEVHEFNANDAYEKIQKRAERRVMESGSAHRNIRRLAAVAAVLLIAVFTTYYIVNFFESPDLIVVKNQREKPVNIDLEDGSVVWLNQSAVLSYPDVFKGDFREVSLAGKAFFEVTERKDCPFVVQTSNSKITVLGTSFNINSSHGLTEVMVQSGIVEVKSIVSNKKVMVNENHTAVVRNGDLIRFETQNPNYMGWKSGVFEFHNASLIEVVKDLNSYYSNQLEIDSTQSYDCSLSAKFEKEKLEDILEVLQTTCDISVEKVNDIYRIHK